MHATWCSLNRYVPDDVHVAAACSCRCHRPVLIEDEDGAPYPDDIQELIRLAGEALPHLDAAAARPSGRRPQDIAVRIRAILDRYPVDAVARSQP